MLRFVCSSEANIHDMNICLFTVMAYAWVNSIINGYVNIWRTHQTWSFAAIEIQKLFVADKIVCWWFKLISEFIHCSPTAN